MGLQYLGDDSGTGIDLQFAHDTLDMIFDRMFANLHVNTDFFVRFALDKQFRDGLLPLGELRRAEDLVNPHALGHFFDENQ